MVYDCEFCNNFSSCGLDEHVLKSVILHKTVCPAIKHLRDGKMPDGYYVVRMPSGKWTYFRYWNWEPKAERFTGFDGIPDWTEKDSEIAKLKAEVKQWQKDFMAISECRDAAVEQYTSIRERVTSCKERAYWWSTRGFILFRLSHVLEAFDWILS